VIGLLGSKTQQYSSASEATGWYTQATVQQDPSLTVECPSGRFARGTVLIARRLT